MNNPLYKSVYDYILQEIKQGKFPYRKKIPSENALAIKYNVSRVTIRQALKYLEDDGYIEKRKGSGTYVIYTKNKHSRERSSYILTFHEEMKYLGLIPSTKILFFEIIKVPSDIKNILMIEKDDLVYHFQRVRLGNNIPFVIETTYIPVKLIPDLNFNILLKSKYDFFEKQKNMQIAYSDQTIKAILANEEIANKLQIEKNMPLPLILNTTILDNGDVIDYTELAINPDYYEMHYIKLRKIIKKNPAD